MSELLSPLFAAFHGRNDADLLRHVCDALPFLVSYVNTDQRYVFVNRVYEDAFWFGVPRQQLIGRSIREAVGDEEYAVIRPYIEAALRGETVSYEIESVEPTTSVPYREATYLPDRDPQTGQIRGYVAVIQDVTARRRASERITFLAHHDPLTGLLNRLAFREQLEEAIQQAAAGNSLAVLFLDLDEFKPINDQFGHDTGDAILQQMASRLAASLPPGGCAGRLGGDEFALFLFCAEGLDTPFAVAQSLLSALSAPLRLDQETFYLSASIGISRYPEHGRNATDLLRHADQQMYAAKRQAKTG